MGEIGRRLVHASGVGYPAIFLLGLVTWEQLQVLLGISLGVAIVLETLRLRVGLDWWIYEHLTRPYEADAVAGYGLYMCSITLVSFVFDWEIAVPAMLMLMLGDPVSGYLGSGKLKRIKSIRAMSGMFVVSFLVTVPFALAILENYEWAIVAALLGASAGTVADAIKPTIGSFVVDDNLTIPIFGAIALWLAFRFLPPII